MLDFSKDLLENIVELYKTGKGYENIIREMRMPVSRVQTVIKKLKVSDEEKATTSSDKQDCLRESGVAGQMINGLLNCRKIKVRSDLKEFHVDRLNKISQFARHVFSQLPPSTKSLQL